MAEDQTEEKQDQKAKQPAKKAPAHRKKITFNLRFTLILIAIVGVFGVGVHFLHAFQVDRNADSLLAKARRSLADENLDEAAKYLRVYIGFRPKDAKAVAELAQILDRKARTGAQLVNAYRTYQQALRLDSEREDLLFRSAEIARLIGRNQDALSGIKILRKNAPDDPKLSLLAAKCYLADDRIRESTNEYLATIQNEQSNLEAYQGLTYLFSQHFEELPTAEQISESTPEVLRSLFTAKRTQDSALETDSLEVRQQKKIEVLLNEMVRLGEPTDEAYLERARIRMGNDKFQLAESDIAEASKLVETNTDILQLQSQLALKKAYAADESQSLEQREENLNKLDEFATAGLKLSEDRPVFYNFLYQHARLTGEFETAQKHLEDGIAAVDEDIKSADIEKISQLSGQKLNFQFSLAGLLIDQAIQETVVTARENKLEESIEIIDQLKLDNLKGGNNESLNAYAEFLEGRIHIVRNEWKLAIPKLERSRNALPKTENSQSQLAGQRRQIDLFLGLCYEKLNNPDRQIVVYRRALEDDPFWPIPRLELARTLAKVNRNEDAIRSYRVPVLRNFPGAHVELARLLLQRELAKKQELRNYDNVENALQIEEDLRVQNDLPASAKVHELRIDLLWQQGKKKEAKQLLSDALVQFPESPEFVALQVNLLLANEELTNEEKFAESNSILTEAKQKFGDLYALRVTELNVIRRTAPENAEELVEKLSANLDDLSDEEQSFFLRNSAQTYFALGNQTEATNALKRLSSAELEPLTSRLSLIELAATDGEEKRVTQLLKEIRDIEGQGGPFGNVIEVQQILREIIKADPQELDGKTVAVLNRSRTLLKQAKSQRASWTLPTRLLGDIERILGNEDVAIEYYRSAISQGDFTEAVVKYVVNSLFLKNNKDAAQQVIQQVTDERPEMISGDIARVAWRLEWGRENTDQALQIADDVTKDSKSYQDFLWLSQLRYARGERGESVEGPLLNALQKFPETPEVVLAYITYLEQVERHEDALKELVKATEFLPKKPASLIPLTLGRGYEILKDIEKAEEQLQAAIKVDPDNHAIHLQLAGFYIRNNEFQKAQVHLTALTNSNAEIPANLRDLANRLRIELIAYGGNYSDGERALKLLEESKKDNEPLTPTELRVKAEILSRRSTKHDLQELLKVLIAIDDRNSANIMEKFQIAKIYDQLGNWDEAKLRYTAIVDEKPEMQSLRLAFVEALLKHEEAQEARQQLDQVNKRVSNSLLLKLLEIQVINAEQGIEPASTELKTYLEQDFAKTQPEQVLRDLLVMKNGLQLLDQLKNEVIVKGSDEESSIIQGIKQLQARDIEKAIQALLPVMKNELVRKHIHSFYYQAGSRLLVELKEYAAAEELWRKSLELVPRTEDYIQLVSLLAQQGRVADALDLCEAELWQKIPDAQAAQVTIAALRTGDPTPQQIQRAEALVSKVMNKTSASVLNRFLADIKDLGGEHEQAILLYRQVLSQNQQDIIALNNMAYLSALIGKDLKFSLDSINQAISMKGPIGALLDTRGVVYLKRKEYDNAIKDLKRANSETPSASTLFRLSQAYWESGNKIDAKLYLDKAQEMGLKRKAIHPLDANDYDLYLQNFETTN